MSKDANDNVLSRRSAAILLSWMVVSVEASWLQEHHDELTEDQLIMAILFLAYSVIVASVVSSVLFDAERKACMSGEEAKQHRPMWLTQNAEQVMFGATGFMIISGVIETEVHGAEWNDDLHTAAVVLGVLGCLAWVLWGVTFVAPERRDSTFDVESAP